MKKTIFVVLTSIILTTVIVKAVDNPEVFTATINVILGGKEKCPDDMVFVPTANGGFCIDKYENSPAADCPHQDPQSQAETKDNLDSTSCKPVSVAGAIPWRFISQDQARLACSKAKKRLPTNEEWYLAALGTPDPNGNWQKEDCNLANNWNQQPGKTGSGKNCISSAGAYDMVGNIWEWVNDTSINGIVDNKILPERGYIDSTDGKGLPASTNPSLPNPNYNEDFFWIQKDGIKAFARGGYWNNQAAGGYYSIYLIHPPSYAGPATGFRCAK